MKRRINITAVSSVAMLVISIVLWFAIPYGIADTKSAVDIGPRAFPQVVTSAIAVLSLLQLILLALKVQKGTYIEICFMDKLPVLIAMLLAFLAVLSAKYINLILSAVLCAEGFLILLKSKNWKYYAAVAVTGVIMFVLLRYVMHIRF